MRERELYAAPRMVTDIRDCAFYHSMNIPGYGEIQGDWDLRGIEHRYLGGVDFRGKRVLEMGTASGFFCFYMERQGAEVVSFDLSEEYNGDVVPFAGFDHELILTERREAIRKRNNGYWLGHRAYGSRFRTLENWDTWWYLPPPVLKNYLGVLGFHRTKVHYFFNRYRGRRLAYALVGKRQ